MKNIIWTWVRFSAVIELRLRKVMIAWTRQQVILKRANNNRFMWLYIPWTFTAVTSVQNIPSALWQIKSSPTQHSHTWNPRSLAIAVATSADFPRSIQWWRKVLIKTLRHMSTDMWGRSFTLEVHPCPCCQTHSFYQVEHPTLQNCMDCASALSQERMV